jgi:hypothetical protein
VSRDVRIHQAQDQGIKAVGSGAGRDDHDQHEGIEDLGQIERLRVSAMSVNPTPLSSICIIVAVLSRTAMLAPVRRAELAAGHR